MFVATQTWQVQAKRQKDIYFHIFTCHLLSGYSTVFLLQLLLSKRVCFWNAFIVLCSIKVIEAWLPYLLNCFNFFFQITSPKVWVLRTAAKTRLRPPFSTRQLRNATTGKLIEKNIICKINFIFNRYLSMWRYEWMNEWSLFLNEMHF